MPELNLGPTQHHSPLKSVVIAAIALLAIAAAIFYLSPRKTAVITVANVQTYAVHTTTKSSRQSGSIVGQPAESQNDLYVAVTLRIQSKFPAPIFLNGISAVYTTPQDTVLNADAIGASGITDVETIFPDLAPLIAHPLALDATVPAHSTAQGTVLLQFPDLTNATWRSRKSAVLTISFIHQSPITVVVPQ